MFPFQHFYSYRVIVYAVLSVGDKVQKVTAGYVAWRWVSCLLNSLLSFVSPLGCIIALPTCPIPFVFRLTDLLLSFFSPGLLEQPPSVSVASDLCSRLLPE